MADELDVRRFGRGRDAVAPVGAEPVGYGPAMIWKRRPSPKPPERPSDEGIMELLRDALREIAPRWSRAARFATA
jgi:hypothetical protein